MDLEALVYMTVFGLIEAKNKEFSKKMCSKRLVYIFKSHEEFKNYFIKNGFKEIDDDILSLCRIKKTKKGLIIAFKRLCDYTIVKFCKLNDEEYLHASLTKKYFQ